MYPQFLVFLPLLLLLLWRFVIIYVMVPANIKSQPLWKATSKYLPFDPATLGPEVVNFFHSHVVALTAQGFVVIQYLTKPEAQKNLTTVMIYLVNRERGERCTVACFYVTTQAYTKVKGHNVILTTRFDDDTAITTSNVTSVGSFRKRPTIDSVSIADLTDPTALVNVHRFRVAKLADGKRPIIPPSGVEVEDFEAYERTAVDYQVTAGLAYFDEREQAYIRTWYGAFYMTWQLLWPFKQINLARKRSKADTVMKEFLRTR